MQAKRGIKLEYATGLTTEYILVLLIVFFTAFQLSAYVSLTFMATFLFFALMMISFLKTCEVSAALFLLLFLSFCNVVLNALFSSQAQIGFSYFKKFIMFLCTMFYFYSAVEVKISDKMKKILVGLPILMGALLTISYYFFDNRAMIAHSITLGFVNSNFTGMWLAHIMMYAIYGAIDSRKIPIKILCLVMVFFCAQLLYMTYARSVFLGIFMFAVMLVLGFFLREKACSKPILVGIAVLPLVLALVYLALGNSRWLAETFSFLVREGKKLNARNELWLVALESARRNPILGNYSGVSNGVGFSQLHNTHIDVLCSYGVFPLALFVYALYEIMSKAAKKIHSLSQYVAFCSFVSIIVLGTFEAAIVAGSTGLYFLSGGFLFLTCMEREPEERKTQFPAFG